MDYTKYCTDMNEEVLTWLYATTHGRHTTFKDYLNYKLVFITYHGDIGGYGSEASNINWNYLTNTYSVEYLPYSAYRSRFMIPHPILSARK
jgi:hypothetical protein